MWSSRIVSPRPSTQRFIFKQARVASLCCNFRRNPGRGFSELCLMTSPVFRSGRIRHSRKEFEVGICFALAILPMNFIQPEQSLSRFNNRRNRRCHSATFHTTSGTRHRVVFRPERKRQRGQPSHSYGKTCSQGHSRIPPRKRNRILRPTNEGVLMSHLNASIRNDHLRISLSEEQIDLKDLHQMRSEFMEYLKQNDIADVVIVDLPGIQKLDSRMVRLIQSWTRMAASFGRTLRLNGVSRVLHDLQQHINRPHHRSVAPTATL